MTDLIQLRLFRKDIPFTHEQFYEQYRYISADFNEHVVLESGRGGRYSIAAFNPEKIFIGHDGQLQVVEQEKTQTLNGDPFHLLKEQLAAYRVHQDEGIPGGAFGYISYDYARYIEDLPKIAKDDLGIPMLIFFVCEQWFVFDHAKKQLSLYFLAESENSNTLKQRMLFWEEQWLKKIEPTSSKPLETVVEGELEVSMSEAEFMAAVTKIQRYISQGDVFQVNLSVRQSNRFMLLGWRFTRN